MARTSLGRAGPALLGHARRVPSHARVAVVGAGISGAACARELHRAGVGVEVRERSRAAGGRLASRRVEGRPVDLGASYLTARDPDFLDVVEGWVDRGLARPWTDAFHVAGPDGLGELKPGPLRYGTATGSRSLVEDLLTGLPVVQGAEAGTVGPGPLLDGRPYDVVVLAMPDPQALRLLDPALTQERAAVEDRVWEPVLALAAGFDRRSWAPELDGCFVQDSPLLTWIADDGRRRGDDAAVLVAHSTSACAAAHLEQPADASGDLLQAVQAVLGIDDPPRWERVHRWSYARPVDGREQSFHLGEAGVGLCGDGWGSPRVETAWLSGTRLGRAIAQRLLD